MKVPYLAAASGIALTLALVSPTVFAYGVDYKDPANSWPLHYRPTRETTQGKNARTQVVDESLAAQWQKPRPKNANAIDIYDRNYQNGYRKYLDANTANNPLPTPASTGTYSHIQTIADGYLTYTK